MDFFDTILEDVSLLGKQYGEPELHRNEETRSRFIAGYFNRIVALFDNQLQNTSETLMQGRFSSSGRVEYHYRTIGAFTVLFIEVKLEIGSKDEWLNCIAQIIAEADACDYLNDTLGICSDIMGILTDGSRWQFFKFNGATMTLAKGSREIFIPKALGTDFEQRDEYIEALWKVREYLLSVFPQGYTNEVEAFLERSENSEVDPQTTARLEMSAENELASLSEPVELQAAVAAQGTGTGTGTGTGNNRKRPPPVEITDDLRLVKQRELTTPPSTPTNSRRASTELWRRSVMKAREARSMLETAALLPRGAEEREKCADEGKRVIETSITLAPYSREKAFGRLRVNPLKLKQT